MNKKFKKSLMFALFASAMAFSVVGATQLRIASAQPVVDDEAFNMVEGASVRITEPYGMRFKAQMGKTTYDNLMSSEINETKRAGMYVVPSAYVENEAAYEDGATIGEYQNFRQKLDLVFYDSADSEVENKIYAGDDGYYYMNGVIANFKLENYGREFVGIAYIETTDTSTNTTTYEFAEFAISDNARTATYVASAAWETYTAQRDMLADYVYGAYLYENKDVTYDETIKAYKQGNEEYSALSEIITALNCSFALDVAETSINLEVFAQQTLEAVFKESGVDTGLDLAVNWASADETIVSVKDGVITANGVGSTTVTASVLGYTDSVTFTVTDSRTVVPLSAVDYDLSTTDALTVSGIGGSSVEKVFMTKGEDKVDVTASATLDGSTLSVEAEALNELAAGEWKIQVAMEDAYYVADVTVATMLIHDAQSFIKFFDRLNGLDESTNRGDYSARTTTDYIVVTKNIDLSAYATSDTDFWTNKYTCFGGVFDGRGHIIDGLYVSGQMFYYMTGTFKNVALINYYASYGNSIYACFAQDGGNTGVISNVYIQGKTNAQSSGSTDSAKPGESLLGGDTFDSVANLVCMIEYTGKNIGENVHVVCGNNTEASGTYTNANKYSMSNIYVVATYTGTGTAPTFYFAKYDTESVGSDKIYADTDALVAAENADSKMFDSADGWASYWELKNDGIYFGGVKVSACTVAATKLAAVDYDLSVGGELSVSGVSGELSAVTLSNGTDTVNVTESATVSNGNLTVAEATVKALAAGEWTMEVATTGGYYAANVTLATMLIYDETTMTAFYTALTNNSTGSNANTQASNAATATVGYYIVVTKDFTLSDTKFWSSGKSTGFGGVFDGRGHVIDNLKLNGQMFQYMTGTFKNVALTNYSVASVNTTYCFFATRGGGTGVISNVYIQGSVSNVTDRESFVGGDSFASVKNIVLDVVYAASTTNATVYVVCGNNTNTSSGTYTNTANLLSSSNIYVIATKGEKNTTIETFCFAKKVDAETSATTNFGTVYVNADALVAAENADSKMFDSADGWASYWKVENGKIYFGNWNISDRTAVTE